MWKTLVYVDFGDTDFVPLPRSKEIHLLIHSQQQSCPILRMARFFLKIYIFKKQLYKRSNDRLSTSPAVARFDLAFEQLIL